MSNKAVPFPTEEERLRMECAAALAANHGLGIIVNRLQSAIADALEYIDNYDGQGSLLTTLEEKLSKALTPDKDQLMGNLRDRFVSDHTRRCIQMVSGPPFITD